MSNVASNEYVLLFCRNKNIIFAHRPIRRDWCAFFMADIDDTLIDRILRRGYLDTKDRVRELRDRSDLPDSAQEAARDLRKGWSSKDADRVLTSYGIEIWSKVYERNGKITARLYEIGESRLSDGIFSEGKRGPVKIARIDLRSRERYG